MINPKPKHVARIEKWVIVFTSDGTTTEYVLQGVISDHPNVPNGTSAFTSKLMSIDFVSKIAETSHAFYKLGEMGI